jgi:hypothetical protein
LQRWSAVVLNWCIRQYYIEASQNIDGKDFRTLKKSDLGVVSKSKCHEINVKFCPQYSSAVYNQLHRIAQQRFKNDWFYIFKTGEKSLPSYKGKNCPIYIDYHDLCYLKCDIFNMQRRLLIYDINKTATDYRDTLS